MLERAGRVVGRQIATATGVSEALERGVVVGTVADAEHGRASTGRGLAREQLGQLRIGARQNARGERDDVRGAGGVEAAEDRGQAEIGGGLLRRGVGHRRERLRDRARIVLAERDELPRLRADEHHADPVVRRAGSRGGEHRIAGGPEVVVHRRRRIDGEHDVDGHVLAPRRTHGDAQQLIARALRRCDRVDLDRDLLGGGRARGRERGEELLDAHRCLGRERALADRCAGDRIRGGVEIESDARGRLLCGVDRGTHAPALERARGLGIAAAGRRREQDGAQRGLGRGIVGAGGRGLARFFGARGLGGGLVAHGAIRTHRGDDEQNGSGRHKAAAHPTAS